MTVWSWSGYGFTRSEPLVTEAVRPAVALLRAALEVGEDFGACHIVLSDINLDRESVEFCLARPEITPEGAAAMQALLGMSRRDRTIALCAASGESFSKWSDAEWQEFTVEPDDDLDTEP